MFKLMGKEINEMLGAQTIVILTYVIVQLKLYKHGLPSYF